ncbi:MAG: hypothetical protein ABWZ40_10850 [Caulobacterales bacterium]
MISSLRDPEQHKALVDDKQLPSAPESLPPMFEEPAPQSVEDARPPVLGVVIAFIVLFWGALALGLIFWPR